MVVVCPPLPPLRLTARWLLFAAAAGLLSYSAWTVADAWLYQREERAELERQLTLPPAVLRVPAAPAAVPPTAEGGLIGRIEIARLHVSVMVVEGTSATVLRRAIGHIPGTALPGEGGNIGLSGHRDTYFRPLENIRDGDVIKVTTPRGAFRYRVVSRLVVNPLDTALLDPGVEEILTLVTCYPFVYVGAAPERFIVRAVRLGLTLDSVSAGLAAAND